MTGRTLGTVDPAPQKDPFPGPAGRGPPSLQSYLEAPSRPSSSSGGGDPHSTGDLSILSRAALYPLRVGEAGPQSGPGVPSAATSRNCGPAVDPSGSPWLQGLSCTLRLSPSTSTVSHLGSTLPNLGVWKSSLVLHRLRAIQNFLGATGHRGAHQPLVCLGSLNRKGNGVGFLRMCGSCLA